MSIVQLKWLGWNYNTVELLTTERDYSNGTEFGQS